MQQVGQHSSVVDERRVADGLTNRLRLEYTVLAAVETASWVPRHAGGWHSSAAAAPAADAARAACGAESGAVKLWSAAEPLGTCPGRYGEDSGGSGQSVWQSRLTRWLLLLLVTAPTSSPAAVTSPRSRLKPARSVLLVRASTGADWGRAGGGGDGGRRPAPGPGPVGPRDGRGWALDGHPASQPVPVGRRPRSSEDGRSGVPALEMGKTTGRMNGISLK